MCRPKPKKIIKLKEIINEEIEKFIINEFISDLEETEYEKTLNRYDSKIGFKFDTYRFKSNKGNSYDVDFYKENISNENEIASVAIILGFTKTEVHNMIIPNDDIDTYEKHYVKKTNLHEQYELFRKIGFLVKEYMKNNSIYRIYMINKSSDEQKIKVYKHMFNNFFKSDFKENENGDYFYYIKK